MEPLTGERRILAHLPRQSEGPHEACIRLEPEPSRIPRAPEDSRRILDEGQRVQDPQSARGQVALAAEGVQQTTPRGRPQSDRHGIDREIAPCEVLIDPGRAHVRQGARHAIALATGRRDVHAPDPRAIGRHAALERRRAEGGVDHQVTARLVRA